MSLLAAASDVSFGLAGPGDDARLRELLRAFPMGRSVRVTFEREPGFFAAAAVHGDLVQVPAVREGARLLGMGLRAVGRGFLGGVPAPVGYLGDLRLEPARRGGTLLARGYRFLRRLHGDGRVPLYATVVVADNEAALKTIAAGRAGLPEYRDLGLLLTPAIRLGRRLADLAAPGVGISRAASIDLPDIVACLNRFNARRAFAPRHAVEDFLVGGRWRGVKAGDFLVARRGGKVVGTLARWDQGSFRQTRVHGYSFAMDAARRLAKPFGGFLARLPEPGSVVPHFYAAFPSADADDLGVMRALLRALYNAAAGGQHLYFILGLHERDPLAALLADYPRTPFAGRLFAVHWEDGRRAAEALAGQLPYLEAGTL